MYSFDLSDKKKNYILSPKGEGKTHVIHLLLAKLKIAADINPT